MAMLFKDIYGLLLLIHVYLAVSLIAFGIYDSSLVNNIVNNKTIALKMNSSLQKLTNNVCMNNFRPTLMFQSKHWY